MENSELDDLRKLAINQSLKLIKLEEAIELANKEKDRFRQWYHEERSKSSGLELDVRALKDEIASLKENLKRAMEIPGFNPNVRAVSERQQ